METWLISDSHTLSKYFGSKNVNKKYLHDNTDYEKINKDRVYIILDEYARGTNKLKYQKGRDSFELLARIDPEMVRRHSKWANRFLELLEKRTKLY